MSHPTSRGKAAIPPQICPVASTEPSNQHSFIVLLTPFAPVAPTPPTIPPA